MLCDAEHAVLELVGRHDPAVLVGVEPVGDGDGVRLGRERDVPTVAVLLGEARGYAAIVEVDEVGGVHRPLEDLVGELGVHQRPEPVVERPLAFLRPVGVHADAIDVWQHLAQPVGLGVGRVDEPDHAPVCAFHSRHDPRPGVGRVARCVVEHHHRMAVQPIRGRVAFQDGAELGKESHELRNGLLGVALAAGQERHGLQPRARRREAIEHGAEHLQVAGLADDHLGLEAGNAVGRAAFGHLTPHGDAVVAVLLPGEVGAAAAVHWALVGQPPRIGRTPHRAAVGALVERGARGRRARRGGYSHCHCQDNSRHACSFGVLSGKRWQGLRVPHFAAEAPGGRGPTVLVSMGLKPSLRAGEPGRSV